MNRLCGWCGQATRDDPCSACGHVDPDQPWIQRGQTPPEMNEGVYHRRLLAEAEKALRDEGREATVDRVAEHLGIDPRTVRRWRAVSA